MNLLALERLGDSEDEQFEVETNKVGGLGVKHGLVKRSRGDLSAIRFRGSLPC